MHIQDTISGNEQWLTLIGAAGGRPLVFRRNESAKQFVGRPAFRYCCRIKISFTPVDSEGIANSEGPFLDMVEFKARELLSSQSGACHALTITTNGHREWVFYTSRPWSHEVVVGALNLEGRLSVHCEIDEKWATYSDYA